MNELTTEDVDWDFTTLPEWLAYIDADNLCNDAWVRYVNSASLPHTHPDREVLSEAWSAASNAAGAAFTAYQAAISAACLAKAKARLAQQCG